VPQQIDRIVQRRGTAELMTRLGDLLIACMLLAITLPLLLIVALAIKLESAGPVLDRQTCIGRGGRRFQMLKFEPPCIVPISRYLPGRRCQHRLANFSGIPGSRLSRSSSTCCVMR
jgi:hypothetical protein